MASLRLSLLGAALIAAGAVQAQHQTHPGAPGAVQAQHPSHPVSGSSRHPGHAGAPAAAPQDGPAAAPYAGMEARPVKGLSGQQIADLRAGRGMGLALPAELNGYPGPVHVLELADPLRLTEAQTRRVRDLHAAMRDEAVPLGERLIAQEAHLDQLFAARLVTPANLVEATGAIGATQATLRAAHLKYHLATVEVLTPEQVSRYDALRGYRGGAGHGAGHHGTP